MLDEVRKEEIYEFKSFGELQGGYCLTRCLWSIHPISKCIALPLLDAEFDNFTLEMVNPYNILKTIPNMPKSSQSYNKKREGSFKAIFEAFMYLRPAPVVEKNEKQAVNYENIKNSILELMKQLPEEERQKIIGG